MMRALLVAALTWLSLQLALSALVVSSPALSNDIAALGLTHALILGGATWLATERTERGALVRGFDLRHLGYGALVGLCLKLPADGIRVLVEAWLPSDPTALEQQLELLRHDTWWQTVLLFVVIGGSGPLMEELFYRGFVFDSVRRISSLTTAIGVSSLLFVAAHPSLRDWPSLLVVGLVLALLRAIDGNLWSALGAHAAFNSATVLAVVIGVQGAEGESNFPVPAALISLGLAAALLTFRVRQA